MTRRVKKQLVVGLSIIGAVATHSPIALAQVGAFCDACRYPPPFLPKAEGLFAERVDAKRDPSAASYVTLKAPDFPCDGLTGDPYDRCVRRWRKGVERVGDTRRAPRMACVDEAAYLQARCTDDMGRYRPEEEVFVYSWYRAEGPPLAYDRCDRTVEECFALCPGLAPGEGCEDPDRGKADVAEGPGQQRYQGCAIDSGSGSASGRPLFPLLLVLLFSLSDARRLACRCRSRRRR